MEARSGSMNGVGHQTPDQTLAKASILRSGPVGRVTGHQPNGPVKLPTQQVNTRPDPTGNGAGSWGHSQRHARGPCSDALSEATRPRGGDPTNNT